MEGSYAHHYTTNAAPPGRRPHAAGDCHCLSFPAVQDLSPCPPHLSDAPAALLPLPSHRPTARLDPLAAKRWTSPASQDARAPRKDEGTRGWPGGRAPGSSSGVPQLGLGDQGLPRAPECTPGGPAPRSKGRLSGRIASGQKGQLASPSGNRTPVSRVTGGDTHHYTNEDGDARHPNATSLCDIPGGPPAPWHLRLPPLTLWPPPTPAPRPLYNHPAADSTLPRTLRSRGEEEGPARPAGLCLRGGSRTL